MRYAQQHSSIPFHSLPAAPLHPSPPTVRSQHCNTAVSLPCDVRCDAIQFLRGLSDVEKHVRDNEPHTLAYHIYTDRTNRNIVHLYERSTQQNTTHTLSPHAPHTAHSLSPPPLLLSASVLQLCERARLARDTREKRPILEVVRADCFQATGERYTDQIHVRGGHGIHQPIEGEREKDRDRERVSDGCDENKRQIIQQRRECSRLHGVFTRSISPVQYY